MRILPFSTLAAALGAMLAAVPPAAAAPLRQPVKSWVVDYADAFCSAQRFYGGKDQTLLAFRPSPAGTVVRIALAEAGRADGTYHFRVTTNAGGGSQASALRFTSSSRKAKLLWINVERAALDALAASGELRLQGRGVDERFALPGFAAVLKELDACTADLRAHWNADEAGTARIAQPATSVRPLPSYLDHNDYPAQALSELAGGRTRVTMMIDEKGALKECMVDRTSGVASLDVMSCAVFLKRARFHPARDAKGEPVRSILTTDITWRIVS